jgi:hypothetical protein
MLQVFFMKKESSYIHTRSRLLPSASGNDLVAVGTADDGMAVAVKWLEEHHLQELHRLWSMMSRVKGHVGMSFQPNIVELMEIITDDAADVLRAWAVFLPPASGFLSDLHTLHRASREGFEGDLTIWMT